MRSSFIDFILPGIKSENSFVLVLLFLSESFERLFLVSRFGSVHHELQVCFFAVNFSAVPVTFKQKILETFLMY